jgi:nicotinamidase-related amidase
MSWLRCFMALVGFAAFLGAAAPLQAQTVIDEWASVKAPPPPALKPVTLEPKTTALLLLDFLNQNCGKRARCLATVPGAKKLLAEARAKGVTVIYSCFPGTTAADILKDLAPAGNEPVVAAQADKFLNTDLAKILKDKGIETVITMGTSANGAVLYTASAAGLRGMKVIVPVDGMSADEPYAEQLTAWQLGAGFRPPVTLTKTDMIKF